MSQEFFVYQIGPEEVRVGIDYSLQGFEETKLDFLARMSAKIVPQGVSASIESLESILERDRLTGPTLSDTQEECKRRIFSYASSTAQSNMNAYMNLLNAKAIGGVVLSIGERMDIALFGQAMEWINAMRAVCVATIGDHHYRDDSKWPPCPEIIATWAKRF